MTSKEIIEQGEYIDTASVEFDECGNRWECLIYKVGEQLWCIEFCNESICENSEPWEVELVPVETYEYVPKDAL